MEQWIKNLIQNNDRTGGSGTGWTLEEIQTHRVNLLKIKKWIQENHPNETTTLEQLDALLERANDADNE